jgi:hypothetical protein
MTALPPEDERETVSAADIPKELELRDAKSKPLAAPLAPSADLASSQNLSRPLRDSAAGAFGSVESPPASPQQSPVAVNAAAASAVPTHTTYPMGTDTASPAYLQPQYTAPSPATPSLPSSPVPPPVSNAPHQPPPPATADTTFASVNAQVTNSTEDLFPELATSDPKPTLAQYLDILIAILGVLVSAVVLAKVVVSSVSL